MFAYGPPKPPPSFTKYFNRYFTDSELQTPNILTHKHFDDDTNILPSAIAPSFESTFPLLNIGADQNSLLKSDMDSLPSAMA